MNTLIFLIISFTVPWTIWIAMNAHGLFGSTACMIVSAALMWMPAVSAFIVHLIRKVPVIRFSWKLSIRKNLGYCILALLMPAVLSLTGCAACFLLFRDDFSLTYIGSIGMPLFLLSVIMAAIPGSFLNMFFALGEEAGWRGFLIPELAERTGKAEAYIIAGIIWGLWHTPMNMMGYNYGLGYRGYPSAGIAAMCLSCIVLGTWCAYLAERTGSIWPPALFHGSVNATGSLGLVFLEPGTPYLLGPGITGIIPTVIAGLFIIPFLVKGKGGHGTDD